MKSAGVRPLTTMMLKKVASPAWSMLEYGWYPLLLFAFTPWFLHRLGAELYGHWMLLTATVGFGGLLNAGTNAATIKSVSAAIGRKAPGDIKRVISGALAVAILGGGLLGGLVLTVFWATGDSLLSKMGDPGLLQLTGLAAAALIWLEQVDSVFSSAIKGAEYFGHAARVEMLAKTAQILGAALILLFTPALWPVYAVLLLIAILRLLSKVVVARRVLDLPWLRPSLSDAPEILHFAKWGWIQGVGGILFGVVDRLLIASLLGSTSLAYYSIAAQLAMQVHAVSAAGVSVIFPKVSRMLEGGRSFSLWRVLKMAIVGNLVLSSSLALMLILVGPAVLRLWIGTEAAAPTSQLLPWLVLAYWILALNVVFYYLLLGMGRMRFIAVTVLASGTIGITVVYVAISGAGLMGAPAGRIAYSVVSLALVFPLMLQVLRQKYALFRAPSHELSSFGEKMQ